MSYENEDLEDGLGWDNEYLSHENRYSSKEFNGICEEAKEISKNRYNEVCLYNMLLILKGDFGFKKLEVESYYEFEEEV